MRRQSAMLLRTLRTLDARLSADDAMLRESNARWLRRLTMVNALVAWVRNNLKDLDERNTYAKRHRKAEQYVVEHLALGKMHHPLEREDPLFTRTPYADPSLEWQLHTPALYQEFQAKVQAYLNAMRNPDPYHYPQASWATAIRGLDPDTVDRLMRWWRQFADMRSTGQDDPRLIGLVLRYRCVGGFTSTVHGSVPAHWGQTLLPDFVECFASPLNHKFRSYHSLFDDDALLDPAHCRGNFFRTVEQNDGRLPAGRSYELNPPFANAIYERLQTILERTLLDDAPDPGNMRLLLVAPAWDDAEWMAGINALLTHQRLHKGYAAHSRTVRIPKGDLEYVQDMSDLHFSGDTVLWFFSPTPIWPDNLLERLSRSKI